MKIAILGAGAFGTALGGILADKAFDIDYYDTRIEQERLSDVISGADYILLAVPSKAVPYVLPYLPKNRPLIVATKGILSCQTFKDFKDFMVLSGPGFADDIKAGKQTKLTASDKRIIELFTTDYLSFDYSDDNNGILMCGGLKNVYAIEAGLRNLQRDSAEWEQYIKDVCTEMKLILKANCALSRTVDLVCGIGDLKLTCGYPSRNYEFGDKKRQNSDYQPEKTVEGLSALKRIMRREIVIPETCTIMNRIIEEFKDEA